MSVKASPRVSATARNSVRAASYRGLRVGNLREVEICIADVQQCPGLLAPVRHSARDLERPSIVIQRIAGAPAEGIDVAEPVQGARFASVVVRAPADLQRPPRGDCGVVHLAAVDVHGGKRSPGGTLLSGIAAAMRDLNSRQQKRYRLGRPSKQRGNLAKLPPRAEPGPQRSVHFASGCSRRGIASTPSESTPADLPQAACRRRGQATRPAWSPYHVELPGADRFVSVRSGPGCRGSRGNGSLESDVLTLSLWWRARCRRGDGT